MVINIENKFKIGEMIYHITPESDKGIIIDISYSVLTKKIKYLVSFGRRSEDEIWLNEIELSHEKTF